MTQRAPRHDHVAQREEHCQRHDNHYKERAHCRTIKEPPPASRAQQSQSQVHAHDPEGGAHCSATRKPPTVVQTCSDAMLKMPQGLPELPRRPCTCADKDYEAQAALRRAARV